MGAKIVKPGLLAGLAMLVAAFIFLFVAASEYTSRTAFCDNCHEMQTAMATWQQSTHGSNDLGIEAGCSDCHIAPGVAGHVQAKIQAMGELYVHLAKNPQGYWWEQEREERQWQARQDISDKACMKCHQPKEMELKNQAAAVAHGTALGKTACVNCHKQVGHGARKGSVTDEI